MSAVANSAPMPCNLTSRRIFSVHASPDGSRSKKIASNPTSPIQRRQRCIITYSATEAANNRVGISTAKQEIWLCNHMHKIGCGVGIGVGAAFDLVSGTTRQAPRWIQRSGLEWLFRMAVEPRRLFRRYLFVVPSVSLLHGQDVHQYSMALAMRHVQMPHQTRRPSLSTWRNLVFFHTTRRHRVRLSLFKNLLFVFEQR